MYTNLIDLLVWLVIMRNGEARLIVTEYDTNGILLWVGSMNKSNSKLKSIQLRTHDSDVFEYNNTINWIE